MYKWMLLASIPSFDQKQSYLECNVASFVDHLQKLLMSLLAPIQNNKNAALFILTAILFK